VSRGAFIAFEGGDGSGKSTQAALAAERWDAVLTRQAGGTPLGEQIRALTLHPDSADLSLRAEALLYMADRAEHVDRLVMPALEAGRHVVTDRYAYSSLAYQGYGRGLDITELRHISDWAVAGLWPDLVVLIDVPVEVGARRLAHRANEADHYEALGLDLQHRVRGGYRELASADPGRWRVVDGVGSIDEVAGRTRFVIEAFLAGRE